MESSRKYVLVSDDDDETETVDDGKTGRETSDVLRRNDGTRLKERTKINRRGERSKTWKGWQRTRDDTGRVLERWRGFRKNRGKR